MSHLHRTRTLAAALATVLCIAAAPVTVEAGVDEAERRVEQVLQELDGLRDQLEQIDLDYGEALARALWSARLRTLPMSWIALLRRVNEAASRTSNPATMPVA